MADPQPAALDEQHKQRIRQWLRSWRATGALIQAERDQRVAALTDEDAWRECQALFAAWEPDMPGDAGQGLQLQQDVFRRWWTSRRRA